MYEVYFTNFGYTSQDRYPDLNAARIAAREKGYECSFRRGGVIVATWSPLYGFRPMR